MNISMKKCKHRTCKTGSCSNVKYTILSLALYVVFFSFYHLKKIITTSNMYMSGSKKIGSGAFIL